MGQNTIAFCQRNSARHSLNVVSTRAVFSVLAKQKTRTTEALTSRTSGMRQFSTFTDTPTESGHYSDSWRKTSNCGSLALFLKKPPTQKEQISQKVRIRNSARDETMISNATFKP